MKTILKVLRIHIIFLFIVSGADVIAEEVDMGKNPDTDAMIKTLSGGSAALKEPESEASDQTECGEGSCINAEGPNRGLIKVNTIKTVMAHRAPGAPVTAAKSTEAAVSLEVLFDYKSAALSEEGKVQLKKVADALLSKELKGGHFKIEGHTDGVGSDKYNLDLSLLRAAAVKEYLANQLGVEMSMLEVEGKGKMGLKKPEDPASEENRRVRLIKLGS